MTGKIARFSNRGTVRNALLGSLGGVSGGALIGTILGKVEASSGAAAAGFIGPFVDGLVSGAILLGACVMTLNKLTVEQTKRYRNRALPLRRKRSPKCRCGSGRSV